MLFIPDPDKDLIWMLYNNRVWVETCHDHWREAEIMLIQHSFDIQLQQYNSVLSIQASVLLKQAHIVPIICSFSKSQSDIWIIIIVWWDDSTHFSPREAETRRSTVIQYSFIQFAVKA